MREGISEITSTINHHAELVALKELVPLTGMIRAMKAACGAAFDETCDEVRRAGGESGCFASPMRSTPERHFFTRPAPPGRRQSIPCGSGKPHDGCTAGSEATRWLDTGVDDLTGRCEGHARGDLPRGCEVDLRSSRYEAGRSNRYEADLWSRSGRV